MLLISHHNVMNDDMMVPSRFYNIKDVTKVQLFVAS